MKGIKLKTETYLVLRLLILLLIGFYISFILRDSLISLIVFLLLIVTILSVVSNKVIKIINFAFQTEFLAADIEKTYSTNLSVLDSMKTDLRKHETARWSNRSPFGLRLALSNEKVSINIKTTWDYAKYVS